MHFSPLVIAGLLGAAQASITARQEAGGQEGGAGGTEVTNSTTTVHVIDVGMNPMNNETAKKYFPDKVTAQPGDMLQFRFRGGNHTVTQSTFDDPCVPMPNGLKSGFQAVSTQSGGETPIFNVMVKDTKTMWIFCGQPGHCQSGMNMVVNEEAATTSNSTRTLNEYNKQAAKAKTNGTGASGTGNAGSSGGANTSSATSNVVTVPATVGFVLGVAFMLL